MHLIENSYGDMYGNVQAIRNKLFFYNLIIYDLLFMQYTCHRCCVQCTFYYNY